MDNDETGVGVETPAQWRARVYPDALTAPEDIALLIATFVFAVKWVGGIDWDFDADPDHVPEELFVSEDERAIVEALTPAETLSGGAETMVAAAEFFDRIGSQRAVAAADVFYRTAHELARQSRAYELRLHSSSAPNRVHAAPRARRRRVAGRPAKARAPDREDDDEPAAAPRLCECCGADLSERRRDARTCGPACRQRVSRSSRAVALDDAFLSRALAVEAYALPLVRAGELDGYEALALVLQPTPRVLAAVEGVAA